MTHDLAECDPAQPCSKASFIVLHLMGAGGGWLGSYVCQDYRLLVNISSVEFIVWFYYLFNVILEKSWWLCLYIYCLFEFLWFQNHILLTVWLPLLPVALGKLGSNSASCLCLSFVCCYSPSPFALTGIITWDDTRRQRNRRVCKDFLGGQSYVTGGRRFGLNSERNFNVI